ncbi:MAG: hypothetical protein ACJAYG_001679 [Oceanicoccus sp.]|jgi:hypothetical protein
MAVVAKSKRVIASAITLNGLNRREDLRLQLADLYRHR